MNLTDSLKNFLGGKAAFTIAERDLAAQLGLAADVLKSTRMAHLQRGTDWQLEKNLVCYSADGRARLLALLNIADVPAAPAPVAVDSAPNAPQPTAVRGLVVDVSDLKIVTAEVAEMAPADAAWWQQALAAAPKNYVPPRPGEERVLVCVRTVRNPRVVLARDGDKEAWVRVRDSKNFRPDMEIRATCIEGEMWELVGRCPRWPGKW